MAANDLSVFLGNIPASRRRLIERIAARAQKGSVRLATGVANAAQLSNFIAAYYHGVAEEDLGEYNTDDLAASALAHLKFGLHRPVITDPQGRRISQPLLRVYNPEPTQHGWRSPHTIVETVIDDTPFLVDSIGMVFASFALNVHLIVHPVLKVARDARGRWRGLKLGNAPAARAESWQRFEIDQVIDADKLMQLHEKLRAVLADVRNACSDWQAMQQRALDLCLQWSETPPRLPNAEVTEAKAFLEWLTDNHFTFLGSQCFRLKRGTQTDVLEPLPDTALGIMHSDGSKQARPVKLQGEMREFARNPQLLLITKSSTLATIHRAAHLDHLSVKQFDKHGRVSGEIRFLGLFTSSAYSLNPREIPLLRHKIERVIDSLGLLPGSHDAKAVLHVLDNYPRDELFQTEPKELTRIVRGIVNLYERRRVRVFLRRDPYNRFYSCLMYLPRDRYNTQARERIEGHLLAALDGLDVESQVLMSDSALARLHLLVRTRAGLSLRVDEAALEHDVTHLIRTWQDELTAALAAKYGEAEGRALALYYSRAFPAAYQADVSPSAAIDDIEQLRNVADSPDSMELRLTDKSLHLHLRIIRRGSPLPLSDVLPMLENMGLRILTERPYEIEPQRARSLWIQDFEVEPGRDVSIDATRLNTVFHDAFLAIWQTRIDNDGFNRLIVKSLLNWREANVLRAYCRYLLQTGVTFSQFYMEQTLSRHAVIAVQLWELFAIRFDPAIRREQRNKLSTALTRKIEQALDAVTSPDEDRILRAYLTVINATVRTNYYQLDGDGRPKPYLSFKLHSTEIPHLPLPKPLFEIFVHSPRVEGIHLRTGHVARGGIRWSDRREDFRTEVLGLMKAQTVKNSVIVPVGAKGGFVPKLMSPTATREDVQREGVECYRTLIRGLLDLTDNIVKGKTIAPANVVRHDEDDPYLVVAADKGTASFSDIANRVAAEYQFWLSDAFASGGSAGYDHKKMAITARGAWECVKRHFRELGVNVDRQRFTACGIGDMAGDVFGNGMLRSPHMQLLAAFNHQHIFLDPNPDPAVSFKERQRLFNLPRSSWEDYDVQLISTGGGVYSRSAKSIALSAQIRQALGIVEANITPTALIQAILRMPVDLLWNGGIGTYVKASTEAHSAAGDRSNDAVRVNGRELRCKVVGEGGNLGFTQRGRVEYSQCGGRMNTDFIDNSGGVDCSDHEVNIKILLSQAPQLKDNDRNKLLTDMTEAVAQLVLRDNYLQSQAISLAETQAIARLQEHAHFIRSLELNQELDRDLEGLPSIEEIAERHKQGRGFTRPELSVLISYSKMTLYKRLIGTDVAEDPYLSQELALYFPELLRKKYGKLLPRHRLKREIITTAITNSLVNRMGPSFALRVAQDTNADSAVIARAYTIARESLEVRSLWQQIEALDNRVPAAVQYQMVNETTRLLRFFTYWLIQQQHGALNIEAQVSVLRPGLNRLRAELVATLGDDAQTQYNSLRSQLLENKVPEALAKQIALLPLLTTGPDIVRLSQQTALSERQLADLYQQLDQKLSFTWLRTHINDLKVSDRWQATARVSLRDQSYELQRLLCLLVLQNTMAKQAKTAEAKLESWLKSNQLMLTKAQQSLQELRALSNVDFATLSVALQAIRRLAVN